MPYKDKTELIENRRNYQKLRRQLGRKTIDSMKEKLGGKCQMCGYNRNYAALTFHHVDESTKKFYISRPQRVTRNIDKFIEEMNKCILVCANCHAEIHFPHKERRNP